MNKKAVLLVEDREDLREMYATALEAAGILVVKARDGREGVAFALSTHPDLILMDIMMPEMSGHEAVERIRADGWGKNADIIYLTNRNDANDLVEAIELGSDEYILKTHTPVKELVEKVLAKLQG